MPTTHRQGMATRAIHGVPTPDFGAGLSASRADMIRKACIPVTA